MSGERDLRLGIDRAAKQIRDGHAQLGQHITYEEARQRVVRAVKLEDRREQGG